MYGKLMEIHFLKTWMDCGGQFENLLTFLKMPSPPISKVINDQPQREMGKWEHPQYNTEYTVVS